MKVTSRVHVIRVTAEREPGEAWPDIQVSARTGIRPDRLVVEFVDNPADYPGFLSVDIHGTKLRLLKTGTTDTGRRAEATFRRAAPSALHDIIKMLSVLRWGDRAAG
jgi:hypothetical protein